MFRQFRADASGISSTLPQESEKRHLSFTPGFSPVPQNHECSRTVSTVSPQAALYDFFGLTVQWSMIKQKPLKRFTHLPAADHRAKARCE